MKKIYRALLVLLLFSALFLIAGCGKKKTAYEMRFASGSASPPISESASASGQASSSADTRGLKIAYSAIGSGDASPWAGALWDQMEQMCADNQWEFDGLSAGGVTSTQSTQIEQLIRDNPDYMVIFAGDKSMADTWVKKVHNAGIPVIMAATDATSSAFPNVAAYVGQDQEALAGQLAADMIKKNGSSAGLNIVGISGFLVQQDYVLRQQGFEKTLSYYSNYTLLATDYAGASRTKAKSIMQKYLKNYDDIDAVICYDSEFAAGAIEAIEESSRTEPIQIYTITASKESIELVQKGLITECAVNDASDIAQGVADTIKGLENGNVPDHYVYTPREYITPDNVSEYKDKAQY